MSRSKRRFFATLVVVVALAAVRRLDVETNEFDVVTPNSRPSHPAVAHDESVWYTGQPAYELVRSNWASHAISETPSNIFLPVQSQNPEDLGAGKLLVASRALTDPNFAEAVVLLVRCDAEGVAGLILNRRTNIPLSRVLEQFESAKDRSDPAYLGGPVEPPAVFALLRSTAKVDGVEQILSGVYLISTKTLLEKVISGRPDPGIFHVYLGYAGWSKDQLRKEVELGAWFIFQGDARTVFDSDPDSLWRQMIQKTELKLAGSDPHALERFDAKLQLGSW
jgi:putative AlgH/UPF0301 family transcriptional regulator